MVAYSQAAGAIPPWAAGPIGEESCMSPMKMGMACAAVCVAMLSVTMIAMRKRGNGKTSKSR
jgi:hypothetical protein